MSFYFLFLSIFLLIPSAITTILKVNTIITVDSAFISGVTPNLTIENILSGKVLLSGPAAKNL